MGTAYVMAVLIAEGDPPGLAMAAGAGLQDEDVTEQPSEGMPRVTGDGCRDETVGCPRQQRNLLARDRAQRLRITPPPILVDQRAVAQVTNPGAALFQEAAQHPRLGQLLERNGSSVCSLLQRSTHVRCPERDDMPDMQIGRASCRERV